MPTQRKYDTPNGPQFFAGEVSDAERALMSGKSPDQSTALGSQPMGPTPMPQPINRTIVEDPNVKAAETYLSTFKQPETPEQIADRRRRESQGVIDSINQQFDDEVRRKTELGSERLAMDNAISVLTGMMGGTEAVRSRRGVLDANEAEIAAVNKRRATELATVYGQIAKDAREEARQQVEDATKSADAILARRDASQKKAMDSLTAIAASGMVDYDAFATNPQNKEVFDYVLQSVGGSEEALKGIFALNRPQDQIIDKQWVGSKLYQVYQNPVTGKTRTEIVDLGFEVPPNYSKELDLGDRVMLVDPANPDKPIVFNKGLTPKDRQDAALANAAASGDPQKTQATIDLVKSSLKTAKQLAGASGRSGARRTAEAWLIGSTDYTNLVAQTNTIKTNVLTLIGDPTIKKFFGPQMSNADVTLMTSAGTTLNPELQSPELMKEELLRLEDLLTRMEASIPKGTSPDTDRVTVIAPDGTEGTIPRSQLQEAQNAGYRIK